MLGKWGPALGLGFPAYPPGPRETPCLPSWPGEGGRATLRAGTTGTMCTHHVGVPHFESLELAWGRRKVEGGGCLELADLGFQRS